MTYIENDSEIEIMGTVSPIYDYSKLEVRDKYAMFLQGNNGFSTIKGDGEGKILVIKDSYANCFVPFLTDDFEQVDVIDLRFHSSSVRKLMLENEYDHVLVMYNSETIDTDIYVPKLNMYNQ